MSNEIGKQMSSETQGKLDMTQEKLVRFKRHYAAAVERGKDAFVFEEFTFLTSYAKYFIEYLDTKFGRKK